MSACRVARWAAVLALVAAACSASSSSKLTAAMPTTIATPLTTLAPAPPIPTVLPTPTSGNVTAQVTFAPMPPPGVHDVTDLYLASRTTGLAALGAPVMAAADGSLAVSQAGGVARTSDGGGHWAVVWTEPGAAIRWIGASGGGSDKAMGAVYRGTVSPQPIVVDSADGVRWQAAPAAIPGDDTDAWSELQFAFAGPRGLGVGDPNSGGLPTQHLIVTADGGSHWSDVALPAGAQPSGGAVFTDATHAFITASTKECTGEILATADGGATWSQAACVGFTLWALAFSGGTGFAAGGGFAKFDNNPERAVLATTDGGRTWRTRFTSAYGPTGGTNGYSRLAFTDPSHGLAMTGACVLGQNGPCRGELYSTSDGGRTWADDNAGGSALAVDQSTVLLASGTGIIEHSADSGRTWQAYASPGGVQLLQLTGRPDAWLLGTDAGWFRSTDRGTTWLPDAAPALAGIDMNATDYDRPTLVALTDDGAVRVSTDDGVDFVDQEVGPPALSVGQVAVSGDQAIAATFGWGCGKTGSGPASVLYASSDAGQHWGVRGRPGFNAVALGAETGTIVAVVHPNACGPQSAALAVSRDGGTTWAQRPMPETSCGAVAVAGDAIWAACQAPSTTAVLVSPDMGATWAMRANPALVVVGGIIAASTTEAWALGPSGQLLHTTDGGLTWAGAPPSLPTH